ncbi:MAG: DNA adenine methylase [Myxococcales bacterium]|nr:MAG: DNA adenine methylase [Myxococcales bacterium]
MQPCSPILKWVGGKGRLLNQLNSRLPKGVERMRHVEPFVGGGALFFNRTPERALLCDLNPALITTYTAVRDNVESVIRHLRRHAKRHSQEHYYRIRERYNHAININDDERAAMFIYLNRTCFNGLHRVNRKGQFNVPMGRYANPNIANEEKLWAASTRLANATIVQSDFRALIETANPGDFIYFDPPYEPVSKTANFTGYAEEGFAQQDQKALREVFEVLDYRGCKLMLSNSDVPFIRKLYQGYRIEKIFAPRAVNSKASARGPVAEVVVRNY